MDTEKRLGIKKSQAIMLFVQMILTIVLLGVSIYLLYFVIANGLGPWMIASYVLITVSVLAIIFYGAIGYKKGDMAYRLAIVPFLAAVLVNVLLPQRNTFQIAMLTLLFAFTLVFLFVQEKRQISYCVAISMVVLALTFSIYSSITAKIDFLGSVADHWPTYLAMYLSIFVPTIMSTTILVTYNVRTTRKPR